MKQQKQNAKQFFSFPLDAGRGRGRGERCQRAAVKTVDLPVPPTIATKTLEPLRDSKQNRENRRAYSMPGNEE